MPKSSRSGRKEDRIQILERELAKAKKKNAELQKHKTIRLDDEQINLFLDELTERIEWSTNRIVDETSRPTVISTTKVQSDDMFSLFMKYLIGVPFITFAIFIAYGLFRLWGQFWNEGLASRMSLFTVLIIGIYCFILGVEIIKEKDRNYIVSIFSALVALVALVVSLVK